MKLNPVTFLILCCLGFGLCAGMVTMNRKARNRKAWATSAEVAKNANNPFIEARQLLIVTTADWNAINGTLRRYERKTTTSQWQAVAQPIPIVVGRNGLAWGRGLHGDENGLAQLNDPRKREGDGKAPAGLFRLSSAFGYAPPSQALRVKLPYRQAREATQCVDDTKSALYNQLVERDRVSKPDWQSYEDMRRKDELYRWGVFVEHNSGAQRQPAGGSCIFLHIWASANTGTAGCTAMEAVLMEEVLFWLNPDQHPVLVQVPVSEYDRLQQTWQLPVRSE